MAQKPKSRPVIEPIPGPGTVDGGKLREALHAFDAGDYRTVRGLTGELMAVDDEEIRAAAEDLRARIDVDPVQVVVLAACTAVLFAILYVWIL
ncbi:MAG TPA: hypothetical protein ENK57_10695 [Polyangiaceae bacterium]|nr:hypothetical protein [Polyangiaceae bacterium]